MLRQMLKEVVKERGHLSGRYATSPYFTTLITPNSLLGGGRREISLVDGHVAKYLPLNEVTITNLSDQQLTIWLSDWVKIVPANTIITLFQDFRHISVINNATVANSREIELQYRRKVDLDKIIAELLED